MDPTAALNILQNHARQKQAELAQTPPQRRRTSYVAQARVVASVNGALADLACELWTPQYVSY